MQISKKTLINLCKQELLPQIQYLWVHINEEEKDSTGWCLFKRDEWAIKFKKSPRTITRHLTALERSHLIEREKRTDGYKKGVHLFVRPFPPETLECMKFCARFISATLMNDEERSVLVKFQDVSNRTGDISFKYCASIIRGAAISAYEHLIPNTQCYFTASLKLTHSGVEISVVTNVQAIREYYYA